MAAVDVEKSTLQAPQDTDQVLRQKASRACRRITLGLVVVALLVALFGHRQVSCRHLDATGFFESSHSHTTLDTSTDTDLAKANDDGWVVLTAPEADPTSLSVKREAPTASAPVPSATALECFQVAQPVLLPRGATYQSTGSDGSTVTTDTDDSSSIRGKPCTVLLMDYVFAWSYNAPFVGNYTPPSCSFNRVVLNFTVVSAGRQYDRLALMYLNDTEIWRTSTAEPTQPPGIRWTYQKDVTEYLSLWKSPQKIIFDLGNLIDDKYTASFNTTLTATFFQAEVNTATAPPSDLVIPISARKSASNGVSQFTLPQDNATNTIKFPRNANRAVFSVSANGQADEEFWWSNVLQSDSHAFDSTAGSLPGYSPWREVQVYIDGILAGVQWPFPVIFTGGVVPSLHRPIVGLDAFDLREHEIDITPWLPYLSDGADHTFTIKVAGLNDDGVTGATITEAVGSSWYVTGKIFVWLDDPRSVTTGGKPAILSSAPIISVSQVLTQNATGFNETLTYNTAVQRSLAVSARVVSQKSSKVATWSQSLKYSNAGNVWGYGYSQLNDFLIAGSDETSGSVSYRTDYEYPLWCNTTYSIAPEGNITIYAHLIQGNDLHVQGSSVFPTGLEAFEAGVPRTHGSVFGGGSQLSTTRDGTAWFFETGDKKNSSGFGTMNQVFRFGGLSEKGVLGNEPDVELYYRNVTAVNGTVVFNDERIAGVGVGGYSGRPGGPGGGWGFKGMFAQSPDDGGKGPRAFMGRQGQ